MGRLIDADDLLFTLGISDRDIYCQEIIEDYIMENGTISDSCDDCIHFTTKPIYPCSKCRRLHFDTDYYERNNRYS